MLIRSNKAPPLFWAQKRAPPEYGGALKLLIALTD
ncbi:hypothetical protein SGRA_0781 [Saprospira grandis str. Lewin]|uniref:Uncharacterized protein n=1 Tax=Saprospira grandis (strain Lewin) TaxID=984262 RepID=H6L1Y2_SAPGL|nr:hypothetical protein SGRA_0781 [Saprospira grandis str. Lewin]